MNNPDPECKNSIACSLHESSFTIIRFKTARRISQKDSLNKAQQIVDKGSRAVQTNASPSLPIKNHDLDGYIGIFSVRL
jgi:hypothetical protein